MKIERWAGLSFGLGCFSVLAVLASHLALTDIHHAEGDLSFEWSVVRVCFGIIAAFQFFALVTLSKVIGRRRTG